jgi:excisionase family DNA binding protein
MTIAEAASKLGLAPATLTAQVRRGRIRATRFGRQWDISPAAVEAYRRDYLGKPGRKVAAK